LQDLLPRGSLIADAAHQHCRPPLVPAAVAQRTHKKKLQTIANVPKHFLFVCGPSSSSSLTRPTAESRYRRSMVVRPRSLAQPSPGCRGCQGVKAQWVRRSMGQASTPHALCGSAHANRASGSGPDPNVDLQLILSPWFPAVQPTSTLSRLSGCQGPVGSPVYGTGFSPSRTVRFSPRHFFFFCLLNSGVPKEE
jgi:hypothetical protein